MAELNLPYVPSHRRFLRTLTTPLLLLDLMLLAGTDHVRIVFVIFLDLVMVLTGLLGGLVTDELKWGYFAMGCFACEFLLSKDDFIHL